MLYSVTVNVSRKIVTESLKENLEDAVHKAIMAVYLEHYVLTVNINNELRPPEYKVEIEQISSSFNKIVMEFDGIKSDTIPVAIQRMFTAMLFGI